MRERRRLRKEREHEIRVDGVAGRGVLFFWLAQVCETQKYHAILLAMWSRALVEGVVAMMDIEDFVNESNRIEGIRRSATQDEIGAHQMFVALTLPTIEDLQVLVSVLQPGAVLRDRVGLDVRVGGHYPPRGGPDIKKKLGRLLLQIGEHTPYTAHHAYESLHPFTDGNGRSGRALWLWHVGGQAPLGFLHHWYYLSLKEGAP